MRARSLRALTAGPSLTDLENSTCATIHKGSEYPAVVITVLTQHYAMLQRNLLYTGVTRGKRLVVLVGQKKAVAIAVRNAGGVGRSWRWLSADVSMRYVSASRATMSVAVLFGEQENTKQVNCIVSSMHQTGPLILPVADVSLRGSEPPLRPEAGIRQSTRRHHTNSRAYCWGLDF